MPTFAVYLEGRNFLIEMEEEQKKFGFFVTRYVEAQDAKSAELCAVDMLRDKLSGVVLNERSDSPMIYLEKIVELGPAEEPPAVQPGLIYFPEEAATGED